MTKPPSLRPASRLEQLLHNGAKLSVPAKRPIKPIYVKKFVKLIEEGVGE